VWQGGLRGAALDYVGCGADGDRLRALLEIPPRGRSIDKGAQSRLSHTPDRLAPTIRPRRPSFPSFIYRKKKEDRNRKGVVVFSAHLCTKRSSVFRTPLRGWCCRHSPGALGSATNSAPRLSARPPSAVSLDSRWCHSIHARTCCSAREHECHSGKEAHSECDSQRCTQEQQKIGSPR